MVSSIFTYIPVIKWQRWEQKALEKVDSTIKSRLLPCIEVRDSDQHKNILLNLNTVWPHETLVDYANPSGKLTSSRSHELLFFLNNSIQKSMPVRPVFSPADIIAMDSKLLSTVTKVSYIVIRLRKDSLLINDNDVVLVKRAVKVLKQSNISYKIIVDLGVSPLSWSEEDVDLFSTSIQSLMNFDALSLHLISGAYPESLASIKTGVATFRRRDWDFWTVVSGRIDKAIGYGDYGILAPGWTEDIKQLRSNRIAIRYTRDNDWLVLRADGKTTQDSIAISTILVNNYSSDFKGRGYSFGDDLIADRADANIPVKNKKCGHYHITEAWSHHIAYVLKEQY
ncbi:beta family protein [Nitrincola alkalilacustris]|uniref:beta family protein n=1 Tax=Nitrincola alkalilacustris TaxID=1571224 RepID=UPI00124E7526|nr:hypothetical protein [Nitrincola alkalilacustris]